MKLVEILAREMDKWPSRVVAITQDGVGFVTGSSGLIEKTIMTSGVLSDDWSTAIVTREMWEAERAKLASTAEWDGEGLPPVGSVCEGKECGEWVKVEIIAHYEGRAVCMLPSKERVAIADPGSLRPITTPEQVAAENREEGIMEMMRKSGKRLSFRKICEALYDAGYRKQEED